MKEKFIDLHIHTNHSDGSLTPTQVVQYALRKNLSAIAITDHDNIDAVEEAVETAKDQNIEIIAGVELSSYLEGVDGEIHILGYFIDYRSAELKKELDIFRQARLKRAYDILEKLKAARVVLKDISFITDADKKAVGRLHFAKALVKEKFALDVQDAFQKYLGYDGPAYVAKVMPSAGEAIKLILKFGGIPVIAHPYYAGGKETIEALVKEGLKGIEAWHTKHPMQMIRTYLDWAIEFDLIATGGSDCHGGYAGAENPIMGTMKVPYLVLQNLKKFVTEKNIDKLFSMMNKCCLCPRKCGARRSDGQKGLCQADNKIIIASQNMHFGEEPAIGGDKGSGTIFFANCSLNCVFCQNYPISQLGNGKEISQEELKTIMLSLQKRGARNINLVTPTHYAPQIAKAVFEARKSGLKIPIVYNSSGYENVEVIKLLEGIVDIYLPDCKYCDDTMAALYSNAKNYSHYNKEALKEMNRQVGILKLDADGIAIRGLLIRHLVLPHALENTKAVLDFIAREISPKTFISLMSQYHKAYKAQDFEALSTGLDEKEYRQALEYADSLGLENGWRQEI